MQTEIFPFHCFSTDFLEIEFAAKNGPEIAQNIDKKILQIAWSGNPTLVFHYQTQIGQIRIPYPKSDKL